MLTAEQRDELDERGFVRLRAVFDAEEAARMRDVVWADLARRHSVNRDDRTTWHPPRPTGLKTAKRHRAFDAIAGPSLRAALDELIGRWPLPRTWGQMMVTFPSPRGTPWRLPHRPWHPDFMFNHPQTPMAGVTLFAFVGDVGAHGGGTLLVAGSHRLVARFVEGLPSGVRSDYRRVRTSFLAHDPWLGELSSPDDATDASDAADRAARFMAADHDITGMPVRVVELTGNAGDVVVTHPWTFHCTAPNTADEPRMMRARTIHARHDVGDA